VIKKNHPQVSELVMETSDYKYFACVCRGNFRNFKKKFCKTGLEASKLSTRAKTYRKFITNNFGSVISSMA